MKGKVFTGEGKASEFLQVDEYADFIQQETGFKPYPGTLNLRAEPDEIRELKENASVEEKEGFEKDGKKFGGLKLFHAEVEGLECCIIEPDLTRYGEDVIELCSSVKLRPRLGLEDEDQVEVTAIK